MYQVRCCDGFDVPRLPLLVFFSCTNRPCSFAGTVCSFVHQPPGFLCWYVLGGIKPPFLCWFVIFCTHRPSPLVGYGVNRRRTWTQSRPACGWWRRASRRRHLSTSSAPKWASRCPSVSRSSRQVAQRAACFGDRSRQYGHWSRSWVGGLRGGCTLLPFPRRG